MSSYGGRRPKERKTGVNLSERVYRACLRAYPPEIRREYGEEMARHFMELYSDEVEDGGYFRLAALWARTLPELIRTALKERIAMLTGNMYRSIAFVVLAAAFLLAWTDLAVTAIEEPDILSWLSPIGFFAIPVIVAFVAYRGRERRVLHSDSPSPLRWRWRSSLPSSTSPSG